MQNSNKPATESKNAAKQVTTRHTETRDLWERIFTHAVTLVVAKIRGQVIEKPRDGFGFGSIADQPHSRAYAQSLLVGLTTCKAGRVLANNDDLADKANREKIAIAILLDTKLAKDGDEGARRIMGKCEPKREKAFALAVLEALAKPVEQPATPKGGKDEAKKPAAPKGGKSTRKSSRKSSAKK